MSMTTVNENVKAYLLENADELRQLVSELNSWDGCLEHLEVHENDEDFFNTYFEGKPEEAVRATFYGDYRYMDEYVRFNGYANLESMNDYQYEEELKSSIDEIIDNLIEKQHNLSLSDELEAILEEEENEEE